MQRKLAAEQLEAFYHSEFVRDQVTDFLALQRTSGLSLQENDIVVDIGGGVGYFAKALSMQSGLKLKVIEMDQVSVNKCQEQGGKPPIF